MRISMVAHPLQAKKNRINCCAYCSNVTVIVQIASSTLVFLALVFISSLLLTMSQSGDEETMECPVDEWKVLSDLSTSGDSYKIQLQLSALYKSGQRKKGATSVLLKRFSVVAPEEKSGYKWRHSISLNRDEVAWLAEMVQKYKALRNGNRWIDKRDNNNSVIRCLEIELVARFGGKYFCVTQTRFGKRAAKVLIPFAEKAFLRKSLKACAEEMNVAE